MIRSARKYPLPGLPRWSWASVDGDGAKSFLEIETVTVMIYLVQVSIDGARSDVIVLPASGHRVCYTDFLSGECAACFGNVIG